jgi:glycosyltransferase involved in cell wall biosynthesis
MRIAIDPWTLATRFRFQGTYVYAQNLIAEFKRLTEGPDNQGSSKEAGSNDVRNNVDFCLFAGTPNESEAAGNDAALVQPQQHFDVLREPSLANDALWRIAGLGRAARKAHADLIFAPTASSMPFGGVPMVCTIHDVTPIVMPSHRTRSTLILRGTMWTLAKFSRSIITVSECSRRDIIRVYGIPENKVSVIYNGYNKNVFNSTPLPQEDRKNVFTRLGIDRPYVLHHGTIQPRKNLERLIAAYRLMLGQTPDADFDLILPGRLGWDYQRILEAGKNDSNGHPGNHRGRVLFPGTLSDEELSALIKEASLVVIPSLYEGFCLPMVESMACGTPTVVSETSCLPEVSGNTLAYFDPLSVEAIADTMTRALYDSALRNQISTRGLNRAAEFSWERCAQETLNVLVREGNRSGSN